jgi:hypothetical protein
MYETVSSLHTYYCVTIGKMESLETRSVVCFSGFDREVLIDYTKSKRENKDDLALTEMIKYV